MNCVNCQTLIENEEYPICMHCGFIKTSLIEGSPELETMLKQSPLFAQDIMKFDENKCAWVPTSLYLDNVGALYSMFDQNSNNGYNYKWYVSNIIPIPLMERINYPIRDKENEYYETKLNTDNPITFNWNEFKGAIELFESYMK